MIYCVRFAEVEAYLERLGFVLVEARQITRIYSKGDQNFTIRTPNVNGDLPETVIADALDRAELPVPDWPVHWCD